MSPVLFLCLLTSWVQIPIVVGLPAETVGDAHLPARDGNLVELPATTAIANHSPQAVLRRNAPDTIGVSRRFNIKHGMLRFSSSMFS
jgi:hypothetical protein